MLTRKARNEGNPIWRNKFVTTNGTKAHTLNTTRRWKQSSSVSWVDCSLTNGTLEIIQIKILNIIINKYGRDHMSTLNLKDGRRISTTAKIFFQVFRLWYIVSRRHRRVEKKLEKINFISGATIKRTENLIIISYLIIAHWITN